MLRIEGNRQRHRFLWKVLQLEVVPFLQGIPGEVFQQDNARPHVAKTVRGFCKAQHMLLFLRSAYSPDILTIEHVWDLVSLPLARDLRPEDLKDDF